MTFSIANVSNKLNLNTCSNTIVNRHPWRVLDFYSKEIEQLEVEEYNCIKSCLILQLFEFRFSETLKYFTCKKYAQNLTLLNVT